jgi:ATP-binding cassette, subfamily C (CFTR/MRP), member 1
VVDANGRVQQNSYKELERMSGYLLSFAGKGQVSHTQVPTVALDDDILQELHPDETNLYNESRRTGDWTVYKYYFQNVGWILTGLYMACSASFVFGLNFPRKCIRF